MVLVVEEIIKIIINNIRGARFVCVCAKNNYERA